jgi:hypothetical protein
MADDIWRYLTGTPESVLPIVSLFLNIALHQSLASDAKQMCSVHHIRQLSFCERKPREYV